MNVAADDTEILLISVNRASLCLLVTEKLSLTKK